VRGQGYEKIAGGGEGEDEGGGTDLLRVVARETNFRERSGVGLGS
jgi:hypothetical protein